MGLEYILKNENEKVSVIIPYYKNLKYIDQSIISVMKQNYKNIEILIIYDDSNKDELKILKKNIKKNKISIIENKNNLGAALSRNKGIKKSKGYYIAFLRLDDYWKKNKLKKQISFMEKNNLDLSYIL